MKEQPDIQNSCEGPALTLGCLANRLLGIPEPPKVFRGIIRPSIGCVFGPSKSGKTTLVENLSMTIAAGLDEFLGEPIECSNKKVLLVGMEEYFRSRTVRNQRQIKAITERYGLDPGWEDNIFVVDENFPRYIQTDRDFEALEREIVRIEPGVVMIDSLTRLTIDPIEDSTVASKLMKKLRELTHRHGIALILIHHSQKMTDRPITLASLAGSRVVGQELDFMIGVNKTTAGDRYIKDVAYRYAPDDSEFVLKFTLDDNQIIHPAGEVHESDLLSNSTANRPVIDSDQLVMDFLQGKTLGDPAVIISSSEFHRDLVDSGMISKPTLYSALSRLTQKGLVAKPEKGYYRLVNSS